LPCSWLHNHVEGRYWFIHGEKIIENACKLKYSKVGEDHLNLFPRSSDEPFAFTTFTLFLLLLLD